MKLLILASGAGTLFESIAQACQNNILKAKVIGLISNNSTALVLNKARDKQIPIKILNPAKFSDFNKWDHALCDYLQIKNPDLILLAGFIKKIGSRVLSNFKNRIINIHPSLLPLYGGAGMYGLNVHKKVLNSKDKTTGITIHLVSAEYDKGKILDQIKIAVSPQDTALSLQQKVKAKEQQFYISVLQKIITKQITL